MGDMGYPGYLRKDAMSKRPSIRLRLFSLIRRSSLAKHVKKSDQQDQQGEHDQLATSATHIEFVAVHGTMALQSMEIWEMCLLKSRLSGQ